MVKNEMPDHSGIPRVQRKIESEKPAPSSGVFETPRIVMPPPPKTPHVEPLVEDIFDFGGDAEDTEGQTPPPGPARVAIPESTGFARLNTPEDEK